MKEIAIGISKEVKNEDSSESFEESYSEDEDAGTSSTHHGLAHVRRLEQENEMSRANSSKSRELKLIGKYVVLYVQR